MAISKERKNEVVQLYKDWIGRSQAMFLAGYRGLTMKDVDELRRKIREAGGEFHIVKNTLGKVAFKEAGYPLPEGYFMDSTAIGFAFSDPPAIARIMSEFASANEFLKIKGGFLLTEPIQAENVKALADLPPLPVMQARLLGVMMAPVARLVRTLAEPARQLAAVLQAYADKSALAETG